MKFKALRDKKTKEFIHLLDLNGKVVVATGEIPNLQPLSATIELMKELYPSEKFNDISHDVEVEFEFVELDIIDSGEIGADIRNKLTPPVNLLALLEIYFNENSIVEKTTVMNLIKKEMKQTKKSVEYLAKLL